MRLNRVLLFILFVSSAGAFALAASVGHAQTAAVPGSDLDFVSTVQAGLQALASDPAAQAAQKQILDQDHKSAWDQFGMNAMVDGEISPAEIASQVVTDIAQSAETAQKYNQEEANYLEEQQLTPEQVQSAEKDADNDLPTSGPQVNPNPSADENPSVSTSAADIIEDASSKNEEAAPREEQTAPENQPPSQSGETPAPPPAEGAPPASPGATENRSGASDNTIFNAILNGEQSQSSSPSPTDTAPSSPSSPPDNPSPADNSSTTP